MQFLPFLTLRRGLTCPLGGGRFCSTGDCPHCPRKTRRGGAGRPEADTPLHAR